MKVDPKNATRHPRSILGVNAAGDRLWLVTIDGRQKGYSEGASFAESALILQALGAAHAINLDGGGSTALVYRDPVRGPSVLNRPIQSGIPGTERPVATHIAALGHQIGGKCPQPMPAFIMFTRHRRQSNVSM
eukprot:gene20961-26882_t